MIRRPTPRFFHVSWGLFYWRYFTPESHRLTQRSTAPHGQGRHPSTPIPTLPFVVPPSEGARGAYAKHNWMPVKEKKGKATNMYLQKLHSNPALHVPKATKYTHAHLDPINTSSQTPYPLNHISPRLSNYFFLRLAGLTFPPYCDSIEGITMK